MSSPKKNPLIHPSTRAFYQEARRSAHFSWLNFLHGYVYGRWLYHYIAIGSGRRKIPGGGVALAVAGWVGRLRRRLPGARAQARITLADTYHGKVVPLEAARQLVQINEPVRIDDLEHVIPYALARAIVLQDPDHIVALECPCRASKPNPCLPLDVCLVVGEPFASFTLAHHSHKSRQISPDEAVGILEAEDRRGHVHHAFFKDAMLGRFYAICNCCACCCAAIESQRRGNPMLAASGYLAAVDTELCIGCGECVEVCQFGALEVVDFTSQVDADRCMGCGVCANHCAQEGITLVRAAAGAKGAGEPLEILSLMEQCKIQPGPASSG